MYLANIGPVPLSRYLVVDVLLTVLAGVLIGSAALGIANDLKQCVSLMLSAQDDNDFDKSAYFLVEALTKIGALLLMQKAAKPVAKVIGRGVEGFGETPTGKALNRPVREVLSELKSRAASRLKPAAGVGPAVPNAQAELVGRPPASVIEENAAKARSYPYDNPPRTSRPAPGAETAPVTEPAPAEPAGARPAETSSTPKTPTQVYQDARKAFKESGGPRDKFIEANSLDKGTWIHHSVELQVLQEFPGLFNEAELNAAVNLRGIPSAINSEVHLSKIRTAWNRFYEKVRADMAKGIQPTRQQFLDKAAEIDKEFGTQFTPPIGQ